MEDLDWEWGGCTGGCSVNFAVEKVVENQPVVVADRGDVLGSLVAVGNVAAVVVVVAGEPHLTASVLDNIHLSWEAHNHSAVLVRVQAGKMVLKKHQTQLRCVNSLETAMTSFVTSLVAPEQAARS